MSAAEGPPSEAGPLAAYGLGRNEKFSQAAIHERSARLPRAGGHAAAANHAELLAAVARDNITESAAVARMYLLARRFRDASRLGELLDQALDGTVAFLAADFGNIQLTDPQTKTLRIVAQRGFASEFLDHFATVEDEQAVCGRAAKAGAQTVIADVNTDPAFAPHRAIAAGSGFRAVQRSARGARTSHGVGPPSMVLPDLSEPTPSP